jgi:hypothetical protein
MTVPHRRQRRPARGAGVASPVLDLRITQVANQSWGVHALLPAGAIS